MRALLLTLLLALPLGWPSTMLGALPGPVPEAASVAPIPWPAARPWPVLRVEDVPAAAVLGPFLAPWTDGSALDKWFKTMICTRARKA